jgi:cytosine/adenosine deaminase-related metal-dependent hydrolase
MAEILIKNADWIVTVDPGRRIIRDGAVAIADRKIVAIGKTAEVAREHSAAKTLDASGKLVLPGLIDTHVHNKAQRLDPTIMPPETVIEMGTINGAKAALWQNEIGSLEVGKRADIAIFDTRKVEWRPILNPIANLVYSSRGGADTVLCDGRILMEEGRVLTLNEKEILEEGQRRAERIAEKSGLWDKIKPKWPVH